MFMKMTRAVLPVGAATLSLALILTGCKGFWDPPAGTGTGTNTGTTATTTTLTASNSAVSAGAGLTLTATVAPAAATGSVTFSAGTATLGTATLNSGTASFNATFTTAGTESITATYSGDSTYAASTSSAISVTVTAASAASLAKAFSGSGPDAELNLVLSSQSSWTAPSQVHLHNLARFVSNGASYTNLQGSHCILYSGTVFLADGTQSRNAIYNLPGGGYLAPETKAAELGCQ
ncbi:Ig-like domain-containing protein [Occallatibacter savannae]|uniref:Ig-like domain-containing protein n=1 Tax=Occallatibacter savannae TaxID=1002691 RepID=UPI0013A591DD|nr:Ig-like domain-containing protein [Occallatibacter savannae]